MADKEGSDAGNGKKGYRLLTPAEGAEEMEIIFCCFSERDMGACQSIV